MTDKKDAIIVTTKDDYNLRSFYGKFEVVAMLQQLQHALKYYEHRIVDGRFNHKNAELAKEMQREVRLMAKVWRIVHNGKVWLV